MVRLLSLILIVLLIYLAYRIVKSILGLVTGRGRPSIKGSRRDQGTLVKDPNCQTYVPKEEALSAEIGGELQYFCSLRCRDQYRERAGRGEV